VVGAPLAMVSKTTAYERALARLLSAPTLPKLGLSRMTALCRLLGDPHLAVPVLHIAGTKGKGSTAALTASALRAAGLRVGLTTSPHLRCTRERLQVNGELVDEDTFVSLEAAVCEAATRLDPALDTPSFFERTTAMAFCLFAGGHGMAPVDVAVVEVGLGGRLDATNIVSPRAVAITRLGLDHTEYLGDTLALIAHEKARIMKAKVPAVTVRQAPEALAVLASVAAELAVSLEVVDDDGAVFPLGLAGKHQQENARLARALLGKSGFLIDDAVVRRGFAEVRWPARYETVHDSPRVIVDGAHNEDSAHALAQTLASDPALGPVHFVVGMSRGHAPRAFLEPLLPHAATMLFTRARHPRALEPHDVAREGAHLRADVEASVVDGVDVALDVAMQRAARDGGVVVVTGSLFLAGEARARFVSMPADPALPSW
jgi:dihydrofolate synthase/folylpolyglutamate synthase